MPGAMLEITLDQSQVGKALTKLGEHLEDLTTPLNDIAEYLHQSTDSRFRQKVAPDGSPWAPLAPSTLARKRGTRTLREAGTLQDTLRHQVSSNELAFGTDRPYGAIHQFGGNIQHAASSQQVYFRQGKDGSVGNRFVKKRQSNFAQWVTWGAHSADITARPFLGLSSEDEIEILEIVCDYLTEAIAIDEPQ